MNTRPLCSRASMRVTLVRSAARTRPQTMYYYTIESPAFEPHEVVEACIESGATSVLLSEAASAGDFMKLETGVAGELLHKLSVYGIRLAGVVSAAGPHPPHFEEFVREANRGEQWRFFSNRSDAVAWLESE